MYCSDCLEAWFIYCMELASQFSDAKTNYHALTLLYSKVICKIASIKSNTTKTSYNAVLKKSLKLAHELRFRTEEQY